MRITRAIERHPRVIWVSVVFVAVFVYGITTWSAATSVLPLARSAETTLDEVRRLSTEVQITDSEALAETKDAIRALATRVAPIDRPGRWAGALSPALAWLPGADHELRAWTAQLERMSKDLGSAAQLVYLSGELLESYEDAEELLRRPRAGTVEIDPVTARDLESSFASEALLLAETTRLRDSRKPALLTVSFPSVMDSLERVESQMTEVAGTGEHAARLLVELTRIGADAAPLMRQFFGSTAGESIEVNALMSFVASLDTNIQFALVESNGLTKRLANSDQNQSLGRRLGDLHDILTVLLFMNRAVSVSLDLVAPALTDSEGGGKALLGSDGALTEVLDRIAQGDTGVKEALSRLEDANDVLARMAEDQSSTGELIAGLDDLASMVDLLRGGLRILSDFAPAGPGLMGLESTRRYLWLGQSADELRATGGFVSGAWLITMEEGGIADVRYHDAVLVDDWDRLALYPQAPEALGRHMNASVWLMRDVSWEPDFPTTAQTAEALFELGQRTEVDGVVALNQWFLLNVIDAVGGVPSPTGGEQITSMNLLRSLERGTDEHGRAYSDVVLQGVLDRLTQSANISTLMRFGSALYSSLESRDLLLYMNDPKTQAIIDENGWGGQIDRETSDYLYVVDSNVGWSKSDRNVERSISYQVDLQRPAGPRIALNLEYNNHSGPGSPGCFPQWRHRGTDYGGLKNACLWNYWRVYVPQGVRLRSSTPLPLPDLSVAAEIGKGQGGVDTVEVSSSYGRAVFSGLLPIGAGEQRSIGLVYDLPSNVLRQQGDTLEYELAIQKQPGVRQRVVSVELTLPTGHRLTASSMEPVSSNGSVVTFLTTLEQDVRLTAVFSKNESP